MSIPVIERAKMQAQVLVPLVKALQAALGEERANALVRQALGAMYRTLGEQWWQAQEARSLEDKLAAAFTMYAAGDASITKWSPKGQTPARSTSRDAATRSSPRNWVPPSWGSCWSAARTFPWRKASVPTYSSRARRPSCKGPVTVTFDTH